VRKLVADDESPEPMHDPKSGEQHFGIQPWRIRDSYHGDARAIREGQ